MQNTEIILISDDENDCNQAIGRKRIRKLTQKGQAAETGVKRAKIDAVVKQTQLDSHLETIDKVRHAAVNYVKCVPDIFLNLAEPPFR